MNSAWGSLVENEESHTSRAGNHTWLLAIHFLIRAVQAWELNVATGKEKSPFSYSQTKDRISETPHSSL